MKLKAPLLIVFKYSRMLLLTLIIICLALLDSKFLTVSNFLNVITQQAPFLIIISFGMTLAIIAKGIDVSMGSVLALSSCLAAYFIKGGNMYTGILVAIFTGMLFGAINGVLITKVGLSPFIATYGIDWVSRGLAYVFMGGTMIYDFDKKFRVIGTGSTFGISNLVIVAIVIFIILAVVMHKTVYGRNVYSAGSNNNATRLTGVDTGKILISIYIINGVLAAIAGLLYISRLNAAESVIGIDFTLKAIAATLIGGTAFGGGEGGVGRTVIGALIMVFLTNGMNLLGISTLWQDAVFGGVILMSVVLEKIGKSLPEINTTADTKYLSQTKSA